MFLELNGLLYSSDQQPIISNEALASLTLFVAASKADEIETVKKLLVSVLNRNLKKQGEEGGKGFRRNWSLTELSYTNNGRRILFPTTIIIFKNKCALYWSQCEPGLAWFFKNQHFLNT